MIFTSPHSASNSHFLFSFPSVLVLFYFRGVADALACPVSPPPLPAILIPTAPLPVRAGCPTPSPAGLRSSHTWRNGRGAFPVAGGAATTGKDVTAMLTLRTPAQFWKNSVSSVISLVLCLFAVKRSAHPAFCPIFVCFFFFLINQRDAFAADTVTSQSPAGLYFSCGLREDPPHVAGPLSKHRGRGWLVPGWERTGIVVRVPKVLSGQNLRECSEQK